MKLAIVLFCATVIAIIALECVRNLDYEDEVMGRVALWGVFGAAGARCAQILGFWVGPYLGEGWAMAYFDVDNVEFALWVALLLFFARHYYRFRQWRFSGKYAWRDSKKAEAG